MEKTNRLREKVDRVIRWPITINGEATSLTEMDLRLTVRDPAFRTSVLNFRTEGNIVIADFPVRIQRMLGRYHLTLWYNFGKEGQSALDSCDKIELVESTCEEGTVAESADCKTIEFDTGDLEIGIKGATGEKGERGGTFIPTVSPEGILSWTNDQALPNPEPVDIKGPKGEDGKSIKHSWNGSILRLEDAEGVSETDLRGPQGKQGLPGGVSWPRFWVDPRTGILYGSDEKPGTSRRFEIDPKTGHLINWR